MEIFDGHAQRRIRAFEQHAGFIAQHLPAAVRAVRARQQAQAPHASIASEDEIVMSCDLCCNHPEFWDFTGGAFARWFYCGPLGLGCDCVDEDPPEAEYTDRLRRRCQET